MGIALFAEYLAYSRCSSAEPSSKQSTLGKASIALVHPRRLPGGPKPPHKVKIEATGPRGGRESTLRREESVQCLEAEGSRPGSCSSSLGQKQEAVRRGGCRCNGPDREEVLKLCCRAETLLWGHQQASPATRLEVALELCVSLLSVRDVFSLLTS